MKRIIDVPEELEHYINNYIPIGVGYCFPDEIAKMIKNGAPIPDNATNGDMIKTVFGAKDIDENFVIQTITVTMGNARKTFSRDWWNAPYERGDTE